MYDHMYMWFHDPSMNNCIWEWMICKYRNVWLMKGHGHDIWKSMQVCKYGIKCCALHMANKALLTVYTRHWNSWTRIWTWSVYWPSGNATYYFMDLRVIFMNGQWATDRWVHHGQYAFRAPTGVCALALEVIPGTVN